MPETPTPTPTPTPLQPLKSWSHPLGDKSNPLVQLTNLAKAVGGYYPLGRNGFWHGGVHFDAGTAGIVGIDQTHVRCIADGEVVAYRIDSQYPLSTLYKPDNTSIQAPFATGFVLVRHRLQAPKIEGSDAAPPELTFYSLYMHLRHWAAYQEDDTLARPAFWPRGAELRVKQAVNDTFVGKPGVRGLNVRCRADHSAAHKAPVIDLLPRGTKVTISGEGAYRKLESPRGPASLMEDGAFRGYLAVQHLSHIEGDLYRVNANTLNVRAEPNSNAGTAILGRLPRSAEVTVSGEGDFRKLESVNQYVHFESLEGLPEPQAQDSIVVLATPVPIKAGELIGHIGDTQNDGDAHPQQYLHLEVFSGENVEVFIDKSRNWAKDLPDSGRTWLKLAAGTPVVAHQGGIDASHPPVSTPDTPTTGTDILLPKSLLNGLRAEYKIQVPALGGAKPRNWYRLDGLLNTADFTKVDGWVCEEVDVTPWVSPWAWEGFALIYNDISNRENLAYSMRAANELDELQLERYHPLIERMEKGPLQQRLYDLIPDGDANGKMTANELQAGLRLPAVAQSISQLVIHYESEWYYEAQKWDSLDELLGHSGSTPNPNWAAGKERMRKLSWWSEVAASLGLPGNGEVFHFHPVGLESHLIISKQGNDLIVRCGQVTFDAEGNDNPSSMYFSRRLHWPGGASGVTLGRGYDMRHRTQASVYSDLVAAGVDSTAAERFARGAGLSGQVARSFVDENREGFGVISRAAQRVLFEDVVYPRYVSAAKTRYLGAASASAPSWDSLDPRIQDVAVDFTYQQGSIWDRQIPHVSGNDVVELANYIQSTPELSQYEAGRNRARYLMSGGAE